MTSSLPACRVCGVQANTEPLRPTGDGWYCHDHDPDPELVWSDEDAHAFQEGWDRLHG